MVERASLSPGYSLGRYELLAQVARGGMGQVWAGRLTGARGFQKIVAIKTLLPELRHDARLEEMLLAEARIASLIHHPNVVQTTELGEHQGTLYLVMEWVDGESLDFVLKRAEERGWVPVPVGVNFIAQACRGLHAAHELTSDLGVHLGVVHRDVSPHNMLVTHSGQIKLVDFGIAKATNEESSLTANGEVKGKYSFMAPEQVLGGEIDRRADVFALGIVLYLLVTGRHPFKVDTKISVLAAITGEHLPPPPSKFVPACSPALEAVLLKALEKEPEKRYQTADALRLALENAVPQAFVPLVDVQLREFVSRTMGDRAAARREAMRRFLLAADERQLVGVENGLLSPAPSQSGGSLRAILVNNVPSIQLAQARPSEMPTELGRHRRSRNRMIGAAVAVAIGATAFVAARSLPPHALGARDTPAADAAAFAAVAPEVTLPAPELPARAAEAPAAPAPTDPSAVAGPPLDTAAVPLAASSAPSASAVASSGAPPRAVAHGARKSGAAGAQNVPASPPSSAPPVHVKHAPRAAALDLMSPYAK